MKTLAITVNNKRQEKLFFDLAEQLGIDIIEANFKPLSHKDAVVGTGGQVVKKQLVEYLHRNNGGKPKPLKKLRSDLNRRLSK